MKTIRNWATRKDPFESVWEKDLVPLLEKNPKLQATTLIEYLQEKFPKNNNYGNNVLRTLQRKVKRWKVIHGPHQEIIFRQNHQAAEQGISDFTHATSLNITINGESFPHLLYHYRLTFSGWEYAQVVQGGESFTALSEGLQNALWRSGGAPKTHRTDSLAAAYKNLTDNEKEDFTDSYKDFCSYYGMKPTRNNKGVSHENGTIESANRHIKSRLDQALMLRESRDFSSIDEYKKFLQKVLDKYNQRVKKRYLEELNVLNPLPERRTTDYTEEIAHVTSGSTIYLKKVLYSVPSRLISMVLKVHVYDDRLECFVGASHAVTLPRKRVSGGQHKRAINYRHLVHSLARKPQAFRNYIYKDEMFPTLAFREAWNQLDKNLSDREACSEYVKILKEAAQSDNESVINRYLEKCIDKGVLPTFQDVRSLFNNTPISAPSIENFYDNLSSYDKLFKLGGNS